MIRTHYDSLPPLEEEQDEIARHFLYTVSKPDKPKLRKSTGDVESNSAQPKFYVRSFAELAAGTYESETRNARPFEDWYASGRDWDYLVSDVDRRRFCPPEHYSVRFKTSKLSTWISLKIGESVSLRESDAMMDSLIFFTGGVNTAAAWVPKPPCKLHNTHVETLAIAVNSCSMDRATRYKDMKDFNGCIQFWRTTLCSEETRKMREPVEKPNLEFMIGHNFGIISAMNWCPLGVSWDSPNEATPEGSLPRLGLLALACGDAQIRIISVPHYEGLNEKTQVVIKRSADSLEGTPMFRVKPIATLMPPGVGPSTGYQQIACTALSWNIDDNQRLVAAGYSNGDVALFDLANSSPILLSTFDNRHIYHSYRRWQAHLLPVQGVGILSSNIERTLLASGGSDRILRLWDSGDIESCLTYERAPITNLVWDYRLKGVVTACEAAFTSFHNRVSYRYPANDGFIGNTVSVHRASVCGLSNSLITSSLATSDEAGEVFIQATGRPNQKRARDLKDTLSLYTLLPRSGEGVRDVVPSTSTTATDVDVKPNIADSTTNDLISLTNENADPNDEEIDENNIENQLIDDTYAERSIANKPAKFLLPLDERAIETYADFKSNFVLEFIEYEDKMSEGNNKQAEGWLRATNTAEIYCDRVCDYPFSSIKHVLWSPNLESYSYLLSLTHVGFCRLDRIKLLETIFRKHIETEFGDKSKSRNSKSS